METREALAWSSSSRCRDGLLPRSRRSSRRSWGLGHLQERKFEVRLGLMVEVWPWGTATQQVEVAALWRVGQHWSVGRHRKMMEFLGHGLAGVASQRDGGEVLGDEREEIPEGACWNEVLGEVAGSSNTSARGSMDPSVPSAKQ
ncbi:hypothetical protein ZWY2020_028454 [Hordeum vulgare]|nr:hypothetical protein ZWY2020_028454 [Hordeum vulgare]